MNARQEGGAARRFPISESMSGVFSEERRLGQVLILLTLIAGALYYGVLFLFLERGDGTLYFLLVSSEAFRLWQIVTLCYTTWHTTPPSFAFDAAFEPTVDLYITVAGEPVDLVRRTITGAQAIDYPNLSIYLLNDGLVTGKPNWKAIESLCGEMGVKCLTRATAGGAKAGNINHALSKTTGEYVAIFDADHVPNAQFLKKTIGFFIDKKVGFVQTPQYYGNHALNITTAAAWAQQALFFGGICRGKNALNSVFMCGTKLVFRRRAVADVGGMFEKSITEDFVTSMFLHEKGWASVYVPEVLSEGLGPEDLSAYAKQQFRWARGGLDVVFHYNPLLRKGLSFSQKVQYLASASYWLSGLVVALNALFPLVFFFTGLTPLASVNEVLMIAFLPFMLAAILMLKELSNSQFRFQGLCFSLAAFPIYLKALLHLGCGFKPSFEVTRKRWQAETCWLLILPLGTYVGCALAGMILCFRREGFSCVLAANSAWAIFYMAAVSPILAAAWQGRSSPRWRWLSRHSMPAGLSRPGNLSRLLLGR